MKRFLKRMHLYFYTALVGVFFVLSYPFLYYYSRKPSRYQGMNTCRYILGYLTSLLSGIFFRYSFERKVDWSRSYIICPNHTSNLDITALTILVKSNFAFLGKDELLNNPVTKLFFKTIDIPVNRNSRIGSFRAFKRGEEYLKRGISLIIFPEGGVSDNYPPNLIEFKNGPFRLAIEQQIPIIPVTLVDIWKKMWDDGSALGSRPGICDIRVHQPIETTGLIIDDVECLKQRVFDIINLELKKHEA